MHLDFSGKTVLVTGHTGFKGTWLCKILKMSGANVIGYSLEPPTKPNLFDLTDMGNGMVSIIGDIRDYDKLSSVFDEYKPEIVIHMAAQPIVRESYVNPRYTYETNVMGTVNICEAVRTHDCVKSFLNVTTDKVYQNKEWVWGYREDEPLDGFDPYSNSKSCSELVTHSYINSFFAQSGVAVSTARAGNVIGGGDFAADRIIPDCVRALQNGEKLIIRNPGSTRPYQHVLEALFAYLMIVDKQEKNPELAGFYNIGPDECDCITTGHLVEAFARLWYDISGGDRVLQYECKELVNQPHEANFLKLDCNKVKNTFGWKPVWHIEDALEKICEWNKEYLSDSADSDSLNRVMEQHIENYHNTMN